MSRPPYHTRGLAGLPVLILDLGMKVRIAAKLKCCILAAFTMYNDKTKCK